VALTLLGDRLGNQADGSFLQFWRVLALDGAGAVFCHGSIFLQGRESPSNPVRFTLVSAGVVRQAVAVQVKRWAKNVQEPTVNQLRGVPGPYVQRILVTTSDFSKGAREVAATQDGKSVTLTNGEDLVTLLVENEVGVGRRTLDLFDLEDVAGDGGDGND
jgi:hypothetical protein